jgi:hypothetical protein
MAWGEGVASGRVDYCLAASAGLPQRPSGRWTIAWLRPQGSRSGLPAGGLLLGCVRKAPAAAFRQLDYCLAASARLPAASLRQDGVREAELTK